MVKMNRSEQNMNKIANRLRIIIEINDKITPRRELMLEVLRTRFLEIV